MSTSFDSEAQKSPEALELEINAKRASISHLVDSLESRFTPGQLFDQAMTYTKGNGGEFLHNLGATLKNNPLPTVLTGVGLAWLALNQNRPFNPGPPSSGLGLGEKLGEVMGQVTGAFAQAGDHLHDATDSAKAMVQSLAGKATHLSHDTQGSLSDSASQLKQAATGAQAQLHSQAGELKGQFDHLLREQPLVLAAIGIAVGAALGAALPSTRKEDQLLGEASDQLAEQVKTQATEALHDAKQTVQQAGKPPPPADQPGVPDAGLPGRPASDLSAGLGIQS